jgi:hypothetical protein
MKDPVHNNIEKLGHTPHDLSVFDETMRRPTRMLSVSCGSL